MAWISWIWNSTFDPPCGRWDLNPGSLEELLSAPNCWAFSLSYFPAFLNLLFKKTCMCMWMWYMWAVVKCVDGRGHSGELVLSFHYVGPRIELGSLGSKHLNLSMSYETWMLTNYMLIYNFGVYLLKERTAGRPPFTLATWTVHRVELSTLILVCIESIESWGCSLCWPGAVVHTSLALSDLALAIWVLGLQMWAP